MLYCYNAAIRKYILLLFVLIITLSSCQLCLARPVGIKLSGHELLCEMRSDGPGKTPEGIYVVNDASGKVKLLIPHARKPLWSPDHKRFIYWNNFRPWIWDITQQQTYPLTDLCNIGLYFDDNIFWAPDGKSVMSCYDVIGYPPSKIPKIATIGIPMSSDKSQVM